MLITPRKSRIKVTRKLTLFKRRDNGTLEDICLRKGKLEYLIPTDTIIGTKYHSRDKPKSRVTTKHKT